MKKSLLFIPIIFILGCGSPTPQNPDTSWTVFGPCYFCGKPGYSARSYIDPSKAQEAANNGDKTVLASIVCGRCRTDMREPVKAVNGPVKGKAHVGKGGLDEWRGIFGASNRRTDR